MWREDRERLSEIGGLVRWRAYNRAPTIAQLIPTCMKADSFRSLSADERGTGPMHDPQRRLVLLEGSLAAALACLTIRYCSYPYRYAPADNEKNTRNPVR